MGTVKQLDLDKYSGVWYEIAKYPFHYETNCDRAKAIYTVGSDGQLLVENQCWLQDKMIRSRTATATIPNSNDPGKLKITFDGYPRDPSPGNYWIHWTDYNTAIVGGPSGEMLWWLSRKPSVKASDVEPMLKLIRSYGYDTDRLMASHSSVVRK